jgi:prolipoprotein diacylglyceryltransferase
LEPAYAYGEHLQAFGAPLDNPFHSYPVYPTQLLAAVGALLIAATLYCWWPKRRHDGQIFSACLVMVGITRFFEELLRASDPAGLPSISSWMTATQWISVGMIAGGATFWTLSAKRGKTDLPLDHRGPKTTKCAKS